MEKLDLSKLKLASSSFTERLKTSGRSLTSKMKEILHTPTPESKAVDDATASSSPDPDWGLNLRICAMIGRGDFDGAEVVRAIGRKLAPGRDPVCQRRSLDLLEACASNCDKVFSEVASEKVVEEMVRLVEDQRTEEGVRVRATQMIRAWGESEDLAYLPVFRQCYLQLKTRSTPVTQEESSPSSQFDLESYLGIQPLSPPERYPVPNTGSQNTEDVTFVSYDFQSVEEKKEFLVEARNTIDILSSILNSETEPKPKPLQDDDLTTSLLDKCKQSLPVVQRIIETTSEDEVMLFDALNIHDELQLVISKHGEMAATLEPGHPKNHDDGENSGDFSPILPQRSGYSATEKLDRTEEGITGSNKPSQEDNADKKSEHGS